MINEIIKNTEAIKLLLFDPSKSSELSPFRAMIAQKIISRYDVIKRGKIVEAMLIYEIMQPICLEHLYLLNL